VGRDGRPLHQLSGLSRRQRFTVFASLAYIILGTVIAVRSLLAGVIPLAVLGAVLIALGIVRIRDLLRWRRNARVD
jgi:uncharacterized membrane protein HdeD (DUF308 family)